MEEQAWTVLQKKKLRQALMQELIYKILYTRILSKTKKILFGQPSKE